LKPILATTQQNHLNSTLPSVQTWFWSEIDGKRIMNALRSEDSDMIMENINYHYLEYRFWKQFGDI
jgi:hypothetical protein